MGSWPRVFQTAPPQPASKARRTWYSEFVGGAEASQKGFGAFTPQNATLKSGTGRPLGARRMGRRRIGRRRSRAAECGRDPAGGDLAVADGVDDLAAIAQA